MGTLLALSSHVARGSVGLRAISTAMDAMGHEVIQCPTILLSNHPKHGHCAGSPVAPDMLAGTIDALDANGWLARCDAVLTGYLPTAAHVSVAEDLMVRVRARNPKSLNVCDPVLGDDPDGLYLPREVGEAIRDRLLPLADIAKPNRFELGYLTGRSIASVDDAIGASKALGVRCVFASSIPAPAGALASVIVTPELTAVATVRHHARAPHGTGDLLASLFTGGLVAGLPLLTSAGRAVAGVERAIAASDDVDALNLASVAASRGIVAEVPFIPIT
jgi:pyridoxine kinase